MKLHKYLLLVLLGIGVGCSDDEDDRPSISQYLASNGITNYEETDSGLIYIVDTEGEGNFPEYGQVLTINYTGYLLNDDVFDTNSDSTFQVALGVSEVIEGWTEGLYFFKKGGSGELYIPSDLAYGELSIGDIGANEDLKFEISIVDIK